MASEGIEITGTTKPRQVTIPGSSADRHMEADDLRWWRLNPEEAAKAIDSTLEMWEQNQRQRRDLLYQNASAYQNLARPMRGVSPGRMQAFQKGRGEVLTFNVVQSCADTMAAKVGRNKIRPYFLSDGGNYKSQRKAKMRNRFLSGVFYETKTDRIARRALKDCIVLGDGIVHVFHKFGRIRHEKVFPLEIWQDEFEASQTTPTQLHRVKPMDLDKAIALWPDKAEHIRAAYEFQKLGMTAAIGHRSKARLVLIVESWHLRSSPESTDGVHFFSVGGYPLSEKLEPYKRDRYPFARLSYCPPLHGEGWAQSGTEQLWPIQRELNKLLWFQQRTLHMAGTYRWWAKTGANIAIETINNEIGAVWRSDEKPELIVSRVLPPELVQQIQQLKQNAYEQFGISQMSASSMKPAGVESGEGLRVYNDIGSERLSEIGAGYEDFHVDIGDLDLMELQEMLAEQKEASESDDMPSYKVKVPHQGIVKEIDWKDIAITPDEEYVLQVFPVSKLPSDPPGKQAMVNDLQARGMIDPDTARDLMDYPDVGAVVGLLEAQRHYLGKILDEMIDDGSYTALEPAYDNVPLAYDMAREHYARAKEQDVPESRLKLLREFIDSCADQLAAAKTMAAPGMPPAGMPPGPAAPAANEALPPQGPVSAPPQAAA